MQHVAIEKAMKSPFTVIKVLKKPYTMGKFVEELQEALSRFLQARSIFPFNPLVTLNLALVYAYNDPTNKGTRSIPPKYPE